MTETSLLLVEDSPDVALIVKRLYRKSFGEVQIFTDAESAWEHLQRGILPDLLILDLHLPGASGADLCRSIRDAAGLAYLPIAIFSHWERPVDVIESLDAGADFILSKDLLCQPDAWHARLAEILPPAGGRPPPLSLAWGDAAALPVPVLARQVNQALLAPPLGSLAADVVRFLLGRARPAAEWLSSDGIRLDPARVAGASPEAVNDFVTALAEQVWRLFGTAASARFRDVLAAPCRP